MEFAAIARTPPMRCFELKKSTTCDWRENLLTREHPSFHLICPCGLLLLPLCVAPEDTSRHENILGPVIACHASKPSSERGGDNLNGFKGVHTEDGTCQGQNLALTVPDSLNSSHRPTPNASGNLRKMESSSRADASPE